MSGMQKRRVNWRREPILRWEGPCIEDDYSEDSWPDKRGPRAWPMLSREQMLNAHEHFQQPEKVKDGREDGDQCPTC